MGQGPVHPCRSEVQKTDYPVPEILRSHRLNSPGLRNDDALILDRFISRVLDDFPYFCLFCHIRYPPLFRRGFLFRKSDPVILRKRSGCYILLLYYDAGSCSAEDFCPTAHSMPRTDGRSPCLSRSLMSESQDPADGTVHSLLYVKRNIPPRL